MYALNIRDIEKMYVINISYPSIWNNEINIVNLKKNTIAIFSYILAQTTRHFPAIK